MNGDISRLTDEEMETLIEMRMFHPLNPENDGLIWPNYQFCHPDIPPYTKTDGVWQPTQALPDWEMRDLTTADVASDLDVSTSRVRALIDAGRIRAKKVGRDWVITQADLDAYVPRGPGRPSKQGHEAHSAGNGGEVE